MSEATEVEVRALLVSSLGALRDSIAKVVQQGRANYKASKDVHDYMRGGNDRGIGKLFGWRPYTECMKRTAVQTRAELEQLWRRHYVHPEVRDAVDDLLEVEEDFAEFVNEVDKELSLYEDKIAYKDVAEMGQMLPKDLEVIEASSGQLATLESYWKGSKFTLFVVLRHFG